MVKLSKYHYFYKITNLLNEHFYYGIHSTDNLDDGYMGSGKRFHYAYKKYGMQNFKKEILKFFDTCSDAYEYEAEMVTEELVKNPDCYNVQLGGKGWNTKGLVSVKDKNGNCFLVFKDDPRYLSGELVHVAKGLVTVKDKNGNYFSVSVDDPRYLSGELKHIWVDRKHSKETIQKVKNTFKKICHQQGSKNSQYGTCWIHDSEKSFRIKKEDLESYLQRGYIKGRKMFKNI